MKYFFIYFVSTPETNMVRNTVDSEIRVRSGEYRSIMTTVPTMVSTPEMSEPIDWEIVVEMFSTSFVIRLIISPWLWVSRYFIGSLTRLENKSLRMVFTVYCESFAENIPCI